MKKCMISVLLGLISGYASYAQVVYESDYNLHLYRPSGITGFQGNFWLHGGTNLWFGDGDHGAYAIEYWDEGLNIYKPYPALNYGNYKLFVADNGNVGIGQKPSYKLDVNGDIATYGTLRIASDQRFKSDMQLLKNSLAQVMLLQGISFVPARNDTALYRDAQESKFFEVGKSDQKTNRRFGFVAQDIQKVFPELVSADGKGYLNVDYIGLIPVMVKAVQELSEQNERLGAQNDQLQEQVNELSGLVQKLLDKKNESGMLKEIETHSLK